MRYNTSRYNAIRQEGIYAISTTKETARYL